MSLEHQGNQFDTLRVCAAVAVIFAHQFPVTRTTSPGWLNFALVGGMAVMVFFAISGYLVTLSWIRQPQVPAFLLKRFLRIWPALLFAVLTNVLVFGVIFTSLPAKTFLSHPQTIDYYRNLLLIETYVNLPGVFENNPLNNLMNGALWTIPMESMCYAVLAALGALGLLKSRRLALLAGVGYIAFFLTMRNADFGGGMRHWVEYPAFFACGALIALFDRQFHANAARLLACVAAMAALLYFGFHLLHAALLLLLPPLVVVLGSLRIPSLAFLQRGGDPSYGIYLYGVPAQQSVQALWPNLPFAASLLLSVAGAAVAGYVSWHLVESPALRLKRVLQRPRVQLEGAA
jgi:peptidoglycan/LPS O-acetylase OafA/YrhL